MGINWKKPIEFLTYEKTWVSAKLLADDVKKPDSHRTHCIRYKDEGGSFDCFFVIGADGKEYKEGSLLRVRNVPEKKRYTVVTYVQDSGTITSVTLASGNVHLKADMKVGSLFKGCLIVHLSEFEVAN